MFEQLIKGLVKKYLQGYVELTPETLDSIAVSLWKGSLTIGNVALKPESVQSLLGEGVEVVNGVVGNIRVKVPWSSLQSQPVVISLEDIRVLGKVSVEELGKRNKLTLKQLNGKRIDAKRNQIKRIEGFLITPSSKGDDNGEENADATSNQSFQAKLAKKIMDNLQLELRNISVEVYAENSGRFGFAVQYVSLASVGKDWNKAFVVGQNEMRKLLDIKDIFVYFSPGTIDSKLSVHKYVFDRRKRAEILSCIFQEDQITAKVLIRKKPEENKPMITVSLTLNKIDFLLNDSQYLGILSVSKQIENSTKTETDAVKLLAGKRKLKIIKVPKVRPMKGKIARRWWRFAIFSVLQQERLKRENLAKIKWLDGNREEYIELYKRRLQCTRGILPPLNEEEKDRFQQFEDEEKFDVDEIFKYRKVAEEELRKQLKKTDQPFNIKKLRDEEDDELKKEEKPETGGFWSGVSNWWNGSKDTETVEEEDFSLSALSDDERQQIFDTIGFDPAGFEGAATADADIPYLRLSLSLSKLSMSLVDAQTSTPLCVAQLQKVTSTIKTTTTFSNNDLEFAAYDFSVLCDSHSKLETLVKAEDIADKHSKDKLPMLSIKAKMTSSANDGFFELGLNKPLTVYFQVTSVLKISSFFSLEKEEVLVRSKSMSSATSMGIEEVFEESNGEDFATYKRLLTTFTINDLMDRGDVSENNSSDVSSIPKVAILVRAPTIIIPTLRKEGDMWQSDFSSSVCFSFGDFELEKTPAETTDVTQHWNFVGRKISLSFEGEISRESKLIDEFGFRSSLDIVKDEVVKGNTRLQTSVLLDKMNLFLDLQGVRSILSFTNCYTTVIKDYTKQQARATRVVMPGLGGVDGLELSMSDIELLHFDIEQNTEREIESSVVFEVTLISNGVELILDDLKDEKNNFAKVSLGVLEVKSVGYRFRSELDVSLQGFHLGILDSSIRSVPRSDDETHRFINASFRSLTNKSLDWNNPEYANQVATANIETIECEFHMEDVPRAVERLAAAFVSVEDLVVSAEELYEVAAETSLLKVVAAETQEELDLLALFMLFQSLELEPTIDQLNAINDRFSGKLSLLCAALNHIYPEMNVSKADLVFHENLKVPNLPHTAVGIKPLLSRRIEISADGCELKVISNSVCTLDASLGVVSLSESMPVLVGDSKEQSFSMNDFKVSEGENETVFVFDKFSTSEDSFCSKLERSENALRFTSSVDIKILPVQIDYPEKFISQSKKIYATVNELTKELAVFQKLLANSKSAAEVDSAPTTLRPSTTDIQFQIMYDPRADTCCAARVNISKNERCIFEMTPVTIHLGTGKVNDPSFASSVESAILSYENSSLQESREILFQVSNVIFPTHEEFAVSGEIGCLKLAVTPTLRFFFENYGGLISQFLLGENKQIAPVEVTPMAVEAKVSSSHCVKVIFKEIAINYADQEGLNAVGLDIKDLNLEALDDYMVVAMAIGDMSIQSCSKMYSPFVSKNQLSSKAILAELELNWTNGTMKCTSSEKLDIRVNKRYIEWFQAVTDDALKLAAAFSGTPSIDETSSQNVEVVKPLIFTGSLQPISIYLSAPSAELTFPPLLAFDAIIIDTDESGIWHFESNSFKILDAMETPAHAGVSVDSTVMDVAVALNSSSASKDVILSLTAERVRHLLNLLGEAFPTETAAYKNFSIPEESYRMKFQFKTDGNIEVRLWSSVSNPHSRIIFGLKISDIFCKYGMYHRCYEQSHPLISKAEPGVSGVVMEAGFSDLTVYKMKDGDKRGKSRLVFLSMAASAKALRRDTTEEADHTKLLLESCFMLLELKTCRNLLEIAAILIQDPSQSNQQTATLSKGATALIPERKVSVDIKNLKGLVAQRYYGFFKFQTSLFMVAENTNQTDKRVDSIQVAAKELNLFRGVYHEIAELMRTLYSTEHHTDMPETLLLKTGYSFTLVQTQNSETMVHSIEGFLNLDACLASVSFKDVMDANFTINDYKEVLDSNLFSTTDNVRSSALTNSEESSKTTTVNLRCALERLNLTLAGFDPLNPVLYAGLDQTATAEALDVDGKGAQINADLPQMEVRVLNARNGALEPLIEPWSASLKVGSDYNISSNKLTKISVAIESSTAVTLNVNAATLQTIVEFQGETNQLLETLAAPRQNQDNTDSSLFEISVENNCGFEVCFERFEKNTSMEEFLNTEPSIHKVDCAIGESTFIGFDESPSLEPTVNQKALGPSMPPDADITAKHFLRNQGLRFRFKNASTEYISIELPILKPGKYDIHFTKSKNDTEEADIVLIWTVSSDHLKISANLDSVLKIKNETGIGLQATCQSETSKVQNGSFVPDASNTCISVLKPSDAQKICFTLTENTRSKWYTLPSDTLPKTGLVLFQNSDVTLKCIMEKDRSGQVTVDLMAPLNLINVLVLPVRVAIRKDQETVVEHTLEPGATMSIYNYQIAKKSSPAKDKRLFEICFSIGEIGTSGWLPLNNQRKQSKFAITDQSNKLHTFRLHQNKNVETADEMVLYPEFVVMNKTGIPLAYYRYLLSIDEGKSLIEESDKLELIKSPGEIKHLEHLEESSLGKEKNSFMHSSRHLQVEVPGYTEISRAVDLSIPNAPQDIKLIYVNNKTSRRSTPNRKVFRELVAYVENSADTAHGIVAKTNFVHLLPKLLLYNCSYNVGLSPGSFITVAQVGRTEEPVILPPRTGSGEQLDEVDGKPMLWAKGDQHIVFQLDGSTWSQPFPAYSPATYTFCVVQAVTSRNEKPTQSVVRVEIKRGKFEGTFAIFFRDCEDVTFEQWEAGDPKLQYLIRNETSEFIRVRQKASDVPHNFTTNYDIQLGSYQTKLFGWKNPIGENRDLEITFNGHNSLQFNMQEVGKTVELCLTPHSSSSATKLKSNTPFVFRGMTSGRIVGSISNPGEDNSVRFAKPTKSNLCVCYVELVDSDIEQLLKFGDVIRLFSVVDPPGKFVPERVYVKCNNSETDEVSIEWSRPSSKLLQSSEYLFILGGGREGDQVADRAFNLIPFTKPSCGLSLRSGSNCLTVEPKEKKAFVGFTAIALASPQLPARKVRLNLEIRNTSRVLKIMPAWENEESSEVSVQETDIDLKLSFVLNDLYISLFDAKPRELLLIYSSLNGIFRQREDMRSAELSISAFRMDNQLHDAWTINLIRPTPKLPDASFSDSASIEKLKDEILHFSVVQNTSEKNYTYIQYFAINLAELDISMDSRIATQITEAVNSLQRVVDSTTDELQNQLLSKHVKERVLLIKDEYSTFLKEINDSYSGLNLAQNNDAKGDVYYFESLQIFALRMNLTYHLLSGRSNLDDDGSSVNTSRRAVEDWGRQDPLTHLNKAFNAGIQHINSAPILLRAVLLEHPSVTPAELQVELQEFYTAEVRRQIFSILGHASFLGNAGKALNALGGAVHVFVNEPAQGLVRSPEEFAQGFGRGTKGFFKGTAQGFAILATNVAGAASKTVQYMTLDKEYITEKANQREKISGLKDGLQSGGKNFIHAVKSGVTGVVTKPREGAKKDGIGGFFTGVGKGLFGAVAKPVDGVLGFVSKTTEGAVAATKSASQRLIENDKNERRRFPRVLMFESRILQPYDPMYSKAVFKCLKMIKSSLQRTDFIRELIRTEQGLSNPFELVCYYWFPGQNLVLVFTEYYSTLFAVSEIEVENWSRREFSKSKSLATLDDEFLGKRSLADLPNERARTKRDISVRLLWNVRFNSRTNAQKFIETKLTAKEYSVDEIVRKVKMMLLT